MSLPTAKRESLKELQTRLTQRLALARDSRADRTWLAVKAGSGNYLLSLLQSGEILPSARLHSVPRTAEWFMGVLNIRGSLFGAVDLGHYIGQSLSAASQTRLQSKQNVFEDDQGRFVTLNPLLDVNCALYVSELIGLRAVDSFISSLPRVLEAPAYFGPQFLDEQDTVWQELDLQILAQTPHFINISAS